MDPGDADREELENRVAELEQTVSKMLPDRRGVLKGLGAAAVGGAAVGASSGGASGQSGAAGRQGTPENPNDMYAWDLDVANEVVTDLPMGGNDIENAGSVSANDINNRAQVSPDLEHSTLKSAHDSLPSSGGVIEVVDTPTENADVQITKPVKIIGQGMPYSEAAPAYVDLNENTLHIQVKGVTTQNLQVQNGKVIIGEHDVFGGRHDIRLSVISSPTDGIEFRGGSLDSSYDIKAHDCAGDGVVWNLDSDGVDYFNQNTVYLMSHNNAGRGVVMTGFGTDNSAIAGNDFLRFDSEQNDGNGWVVDDFINILGNKFLGYGIEASGTSGVDVQPDDGKNNLVHWELIDNGGTLNIGGELKLSEGEQLAGIDADNGTVKHETGVSSYPGSFRFVNEVNEYTVGTTTTTLRGVGRTSIVEIQGESTSDGTVSFVDVLSVIGFGSVSIINEHERKSPAARSYQLNGNTLEMSVASGEYIIHAEFRNSQNKV